MFQAALARGIELTKSQQQHLEKILKADGGEALDLGPDSCVEIQFFHDLKAGGHLTEEDIQLALIKRGMLEAGFHPVLFMWKRDKHMGSSKRDANVL